LLIQSLIGWPQKRVRKKEAGKRKRNRKSLDGGDDLEPEVLVFNQRNGKVVRVEI